MNEFSQIVLVVLCALTISGFLADVRWYFDLSSHFRIQYIVLSVALAVLYAVMGQYLSLGVSLLAFALNVYAIRAEFCFESKKHPETNGEKISVLLVNVLTSNTKYDKLRKLIDDIQPDIIGLVEVDRAWLGGLKPALAAYPEKIELARDDNFGLALYAKSPIQKSSVVHFGGVQMPSIVATLVKNTKAIDIIVTHTMPPVGAAHYATRNAHLLGIAKQRSQYGDRLVVMGDLNITPWNAVFRKFVSAANLSDTRVGQGLFGSWPVWNLLLAIPIDHILVSPRLRVLKRSLGPHIGSDHYPVYAELEAF